jgi:polar amino acid transport system substrate-binding protein
MPRLALTLLLLAACGLPRDPEGTLQRVQHGNLRVGIMHAPPHVDLRGDAPRGPEVDAVEQLARSLDTELTWRVGGESELMTALAQFELDLVVGGITEDTPYAETVGLTRPRAGTVFATPPGENAWLMAVEAAR